MILNQECFQEELIEQLSKAFAERKPFTSDEASVLPEGYPLTVFRNFLDAGFARRLKATVNQLPFKHKATDLFDFYQSPDLKPFLDEDDNPISQVCREIFSPKFTQTIGKIVGKPLGTQIDFAAQKYCKGQYLLCHDDRLESRIVAFVLYLVDEAWSSKDGGQFEKYGLDYRGSPSIEPVDSFTPAWNTLVFFEVSMWSHHQVAEVLGNLPRLSVAGWLHGPSQEDRAALSEMIIPKKPIEYVDPKHLKELLAYPVEEIRTKTSNFKRILIPNDLPWLRDIIRPEAYQFASSYAYPTWPVCILLDSPGANFYENMQVADEDRVYFIRTMLGIAGIPGDTLDMGCSKSSCNPIVEFRRSFCSDDVIVAYWSFLRPTE